MTMSPFIAVEMSQSLALIKVILHVKLCTLTSKIPYFLGFTRIALSIHFFLAPPSYGTSLMMYSYLSIAILLHFTIVRSFNLIL